MSEPTWEFEFPTAIGAVPKFIAEVRAAVSVFAGDVPPTDAQRLAAFDCVVDAVKALDEAAKPVQEPVNG